MEQMSERCILLGEKDYPETLRQIPDAPKKLYIRGNLPAANRPVVAVIGARECSIYGKEMAQWFGRELAGAGVQIVSGMARGVDGIAQTAALMAGGASYGVLGCGTDICYPKENQKLYEQLPASGGILSEYPKGMPPLSHHFPRRNRIISALADCVLVIEAREKSGTLITADYALEQGKEVYALPGRLSDTLSGGCNRLLAQGAGLALSPDDIVEVLAAGGKYPEWERNRKCTFDQDSQKTAEKTAGSGILLNENERLVWEQLEDGALGLQEIYERVKGTKDGEKIELSEVTELLMELAVRKIILPQRGNKYRRKDENGVSTI